ncbi:hypothetical protein MKW94_002512 [Papaver nudicaule]|uniref:F-box domain-containing protein n=1 Tax=Papaver nudicaule TaxID=74823 RepID=A0AA41SFK7_PAPNU|nr:hypothetical protein [Papaver nudicaule]MCL7038652.1 hypothetical protein [Papaver nudicaule]
MNDYLSDELLEQVFDFLPQNKDRNSVSLVCKSWYKVERFSRTRVSISNCYSTSPQRLITRFPNVKALTLKGKPHFADFDLVPHDWGGFVYPWIQAMVENYPGLEELRLKRMVVTDESLELISVSFKNFKSLVLVWCQGFTTDGIAAIAKNCRDLRELDLQENEVEDLRGQWLSCFPDSCTTLVTLNFACLKGEVNSGDLERLVARCPNLRSLRLNVPVALETLNKILVKAPQLVELGTGTFIRSPYSIDAYRKLTRNVANCKSINSLSGFVEVIPSCLIFFFPICSTLTSLDLSCAPEILCIDLIRLVQQCTKLQRLWILNTIEDKGLDELRVFPYFCGGMVNGLVTEEGLVAISTGCPKLHYLLYFCHQMTNAALITVAKNNPNFTHFRLCILDPTRPDHVTSQPLDEGFGAIVEACKNLKRLSLSGLLTDQVFLYIGTYGENLEMLSVAYAGGSDKGMEYVLKGCRKLSKLEIRNSPFGDSALLAGAGKYETMRSLWMSSCNITLQGCKMLADKMKVLNVEVINEKDGIEEIADDKQTVEKMYLYRTLDGPRKDAPYFVSTL